MKTKKVSVFKRIKDSIINFDKYIDFSEEKISIAIKYILKIVLILTIVMSTLILVKLVERINNTIVVLENEMPEFSFRNEILVLEDNKRILKNDSTSTFALIVDSQVENLEDVEEIFDYQIVIGFLKDKIELKDITGNKNSITYKELNESYNLEELNKGTLLNSLKR